jgi:prepilin-type N-terminal cleavage/methylation domain-containing protein
MLAGWQSPSHLTMPPIHAAASAPSCGVPHGEAGFSLVELVTVIIIIGVLAVFALPALELGTFRLRGFADELKAQSAAMQRLALTQRRPVVATFTTTGATFAYVSGDAIASVPCPSATSPCLAESGTRTVTFNADNSGSTVTSTGSALPVTVSYGSTSMAYQIETETGLFRAVP